MPLSTFLDSDPRAAFSRQTSMMSPQMGRFFSNQYNNIYDQFRGGIPDNPGMDFSSFLQMFPWLQNYQSFAPYQRGFRPSTFSPMTRRLDY